MYPIPRLHVPTWSALPRRTNCRSSFRIRSSSTGASKKTRRYATVAESDVSSSSSPSPSPSSSSNNPFPYPRHRNPTPHQIFHLPRNATERDIKTRYFQLVRIYHPDKVTLQGSISAELAHERFQAITTAYDILRGKKPHPGIGNSSASSSMAEGTRYQTSAAYRAARKRGQELYSSGAVDDRWKDRIFLLLAFGTVGVFVLQTFMTRREAMVGWIASSRSVTSNARKASDEVAVQQASEDAKRLSA